MICVSSVTVYPKSVTIKKGNWYYAVSAEICPVNADCNCVTWHSSNTNVATVTKAGKIKAVKAGTCTIYVLAHNGVRKVVKVTVR